MELEETLPSLSRYIMHNILQFEWQFMFAASAGVIYFKQRKIQVAVQGENFQGRRYSNSHRSLESWNLFYPSFSVFNTITIYYFLSTNLCQGKIVEDILDHPQGFSQLIVLFSKNELKFWGNNFTDSKLHLTVSCIVTLHLIRIQLLRYIFALQPPGAGLAPGCEE